MSLRSLILITFILFICGCGEKKTELPLVEKGDVIINEVHLAAKEDIDCNGVYGEADDAFIEIFCLTRRQKSLKGTYLLVGDENNVYTIGNPVTKFAFKKKDICAQGVSYVIFGKRTEKTLEGRPPAPIVTKNTKIIIKTGKNDFSFPVKNGVVVLAQEDSKGRVKILDSFSYAEKIAGTSYVRCPEAGASGSNFLPAAQHPGYPKEGSRAYSPGLCIDNQHELGLCPAVDLAKCGSEIPPPPPSQCALCKPNYLPCANLVITEVLADPPPDSRQPECDADKNGKCKMENDQFVEVCNLGEACSLADEELRFGSAQFDKVWMKFGDETCIEQNQCLVVFGKRGESVAAPAEIEGVCVSIGNQDNPLPYAGKVGVGQAQGDTFTPINEFIYNGTSRTQQSFVRKDETNPKSAIIKHKEHSCNKSETSYSAGTCVSGEHFPDCTCDGELDGGMPDGGTDGGECLFSSCTDLIITEVLADPPSLVRDCQNNQVCADVDQNGEVNATHDEFIEFCNVGEECTLNGLGIYYLKDGAEKVWHSFEACEEKLLRNQCAVIFGKRGADKAKPGLAIEGVWIDVANGVSDLPYSSTVKFIASVDISLSANVFVYVGDSDTNQSFVLQDEADPNSAVIKHTEHPRSQGKRHSPGTCASGNLFPNCGE